MNEFDQYKLKQKWQKKPGPEGRNVLGNKLHFVDKTIQQKNSALKNY
jgi:hypothetical protein